MGFLNKIVQFMYGRYKNDQLNFALLICSGIFLLINRLLRIWHSVFIIAFVCYLLALVFLGLYLFRFLSKNIYKRSYENRVFLKYWGPAKEFFKLQNRKFRDRKTHRYVKCPYCKAQLRVPKRKGRHKVRCPKCKEEFEKNFIL